MTTNGVSASEQIQYKTATGTIQSAFDTLTTNSVQVQTTVSGTVSYVKDSTRGGPWGGRHGPPHIGRLIGDTSTVLAANTTVSHQSDRSVTGLASGSTRAHDQRDVGRRGVHQRDDEHRDVQLAPHRRRHHQRRRDPDYRRKADLPGSRDGHPRP